MRFFGIAMIASISVCNAQSVSFAYDEAGNRIKREMTIQKQVTRYESNSGHDKAFLDMVNGRGIKIRDCGDGIIEISIPNISANDRVEVNVNTIEGYHLQSPLITNGVALVDLRPQPSGIYILNITVNDDTASWKVIRK